MIKKDYSIYFLLHIVVVILGFTAILGKLITLNAVDLVLIRTGIAALTTFLILLFTKRSVLIPFKSSLKLMLIGVLVALHWITFFLAIKISNVSVTLACLGVSTLFTAFAEPISQKRKISYLEVVIAILIVLGLATIFKFEMQYKMGIIVSVFSFILAGIFSVINKNIALQHDSLTINFYEMLGASLSILVYILLFTDSLIDFSEIGRIDWLWLLLLGTVCTSFAFTATVKIMQKLSAYDVVLAINLEPIYGIALAYLFFGDSERMTFGFYIGTVLISIAVLGFPFLKRKFLK
ncbi:MAG: DMT family transporter [Bacteroidota bacterium]